MEPQTQTWTIGEFRFTVTTAGPASGPPVLLLHGFPQTRHMWRHQLPALAAAGFRAVAPDQRGYSAGARPLEVISAESVSRSLSDTFRMTARGLAKPGPG